MQQAFQFVVLPGMVVVVGLLTTLGYVLNNQIIYTFGFSTAASPLPLPFGDFRGKQEIFAHSYSLFTFPNATEVEVVDLVMSDISGPHRRQITYTLAMNGWFYGDEFSTAVLKYGLCNKDTFIFPDYVMEHIPPEQAIMVSSRQDNSLLGVVSIICSR